MEARHNCAYNQTRECFLGLEVVAGDFPPSLLNDWMPSLTHNSSAGIWMLPFRGIPDSQMRIPLDLLYLDENCRVLDTVEFFPTYRVSTESPPPTSVLALPTHSIFTSQTQPGDQVVLCAKDEVAWRMERTAPSWEESDHPVGTDHSLIPQSSHQLGLPASQATESDVLLDCLGSSARSDDVLLLGRSIIMSPRSWVERWLYPQSRDARRARRFSVPGLAARFWTGGAPQPHPIRDISTSGLYVVTAERWHPGTMIRMTLSKPDSSRLGERSITVQATTVRWGHDGGALEFVFSSPFTPRLGRPALLDRVNRERFAEFLARLTTAE